MRDQYFEDFDCTGSISDFDFTKRAVHEMNRILDSEAFQHMDAERGSAPHRWFCGQHSVWNTKGAGGKGSLFKGSPFAPGSWDCEETNVIRDVAGKRGFWGQRATF